MKRTALRSRPTKRHQDYTDELAEARQTVLSRCHGVCERCNEDWATEVHHRRRRSQGGDNSLGNLAALCQGCHDYVHGNPKYGFEAGWLLHALPPR